MAGRFNSESFSSVERAIILAAEAHKGQLRKGSDIPYSTHLFGVALLLCRAGCPDDVVIAGILHDTIEDTLVTIEEIQSKFGERVAFIVKGCSEPGKKKKGQGKSQPWEVRKAHTLEYLKEAPLDVKLVTLADKLNNIRSIAADYREMGEEVWERFNAGKEKQMLYYQGLVESLRDNSGNEAYESLHEQFGQQVAMVFGSRETE